MGSAATHRRQGSQASGLDKGKRDADRVNARDNLTRENILHVDGAPRIRHMHEFEAGGVR
jgi:hypothetical protein